MGGNCLICNVCHLINDPQAKNTADLRSTLPHGDRIHAFSDFADEAGIK